MSPQRDPASERQAYEAWQRFGSKAEAARQLGLPINTLKDRINRHQADPAIKGAMSAVGTEMVPELAWLKTKDEDGNGYSVLLKPKKTDDLDAIAEAVANIPPIRVVSPPDTCDSDLLTIYPIADAHIGMRAWGREAGADYDTDIACARLRDWVGGLVASSPASREAIVVDVGDLTHADDDTAQTPASKHNLDVDTRFFRTLDMTIQALASAIETAATRHERVRVVILPGNHNSTSYLAVLLALDQRYRDNPRIDVIKQPGVFWAHKFGRNMLAFHHGDKSKAERIVLMLADEFPEMWGGTRWRFLFTGHLHHHKSADIGGVTWEQLRAMTEKDAYAASHAYASRAQLQAITLHHDRGEVSRVKVSS